MGDAATWTGLFGYAWAAMQLLFAPCSARCPIATVGAR